MSTTTTTTTPTQQPSPDYREPWKEEAYNAPIGDSGDYESVIEIRTREELRVAEAWNPSEENEVLFSRAVSCVNACAGMADPAKEIQAMRTAIKNATSALEDWQLLWREIRGQQCSRAHQDGAAVNTATAAALAKLQPFLKL